MENKNDEWELSKENIQPLQQGRKPGILKSALSLHPEDPTLQQRQAFENELRSYSGVDPLSVWCKYIRWVEQNFPKGGGNIKQLMQQCLSILKSSDGYFNDDRFIEIWLKFAKVSPKPTEVFNYMYSHNIGCLSSAFYISWSWELEQQQNVKKADQVLREGLNRKAEPDEKLRCYASEFDMRIAGKVAETCVKNNEVENCRSALAMLKPQSKRQLAPVMRMGDAVIGTSRDSQSQQQTLKKNEPQRKVLFKVFTNENVQPSLPVQSENMPFIFNADVSKENEKKPGKWNKVKIKSSNVVAETTPAFQFHCDERPQQSIPEVETPRSVPRVSNILQSRQGSCSSPAMFLFEPSDPMVKPMYDKAKVYGGAEEFSFEEIRAAAWFKKKKEREQEQKLKEQERLLALQQENEKELKRQIETLALQVELLKKNGPSVALQKSKKESYIKNQLMGYFPQDLKQLSEAPAEKFLSANTIGSGQQRAKNDSPLKQPYASTFGDTVDKMYRDVPNFNTTDTLQGRCMNSTSYREAANIVRDLYNCTLNAEASDNKEPYRMLMGNSTSEKIFTTSDVFHPSINDEISSRPRDVLDSCPSNVERKEPFAFYCDPTENIQSKKCAPNQLPDEKSLEENEENMPPKGYTQPAEKRELSGILEPSKNVMFVPLEEQDVVDDDDDDDDLDPNDGAIYENNKYAMQDETLCPPCNTEQFVSAPFLASTPCTQTRPRRVMNPPAISNNTVTLQKTSSDLSYLKQVSKTVIKQINQSNVEQPGGQLSVILETSKECYKSSSSSGSSASVTKLSHCFSQDKSNIHKYLPKTDTFKEPRMIVHNFNSSQPSLEKKPRECINEVEEQKPVELHSTDINPFDEEVTEKFLQSLDLPPGYFAKVHSCNQNLRCLKVDDCMEIGNDTYIIKNMIAEGGYGKVYGAEKKLSFSDNFDLMGIHSKVALKACKQSNYWELYICNELHRRLGDMRSQHDVRLSVMEVMSAKRYNDGIILVNEFSSRGTLLDLVNVYKQQNTTVPELITMYLTWEMLQVMSKIHSCKIIHGDIKPDNVLLRDIEQNLDVLDCLTKKTSVLKFIDMGRAIDLRFFKRNTCFTHVIKESCIEMKEKKPWVFQIDWFGILSCVHVLLFSEYMQVKKNTDGRWGLEKKFRRYWNVDVWEPLFDKLLNIPSCYNEPNIETHISKIEEKLLQNAKSFKMHFHRLNALHRKEF